MPLQKTPLAFAIERAVQVGNSLNSAANNVKELLENGVPAQVNPVTKEEIQPAVTPEVFQNAFVTTYGEKALSDLQKVIVIFNGA